ncbi:hypothetical protein R9C00_20375 [Flammeovirgaceae bacterium SG7u.111]|nr:hypothetical protein [Flammeovirgaceae bacterium SG7u.132]WPO34059.1 hypothetical protein R9C00_20375 [Flammeovirgaceae bacterium SG7u.111]
MTIRLQTKLFILFFSLGLDACGTKHKKVIERSYNFGEIQRTTELLLNIKDENYQYGLFLDDGSYNISYEFKFNPSEKSLVFFDIDCKPIDSKAFIFNDKSYIIHNFLYDDPNAIDEELNIYFNKEFGLMAFRELIFNGHITWTNSNAQLIQKLEFDSTGFFYRSFKR